MDVRVDRASSYVMAMLCFGIRFGRTWYGPTTYQLRCADWECGSAYPPLKMKMNIQKEKRKYWKTNGGIAAGTVRSIHTTHTHMRVESSLSPFNVHLFKCPVSSRIPR